MYSGQIDVIANGGTWRSKTFEIIDEDDGTTTDLTTISPLDIEVTVSELNNPCCVLATASIDNAKVQIPGPGFYWQFETADLSNLCAGTYGLLVKVTIDSFVTVLIDGTIAVVEGK